MEERRQCTCGGVLLALVTHPSNWARRMGAAATQSHILGDISGMYRQSTLPNGPQRRCAERGARRGRRLCVLCLASQLCTSNGWARTETEPTGRAAAARPREPRARFWNRPGLGYAEAAVQAGYVVPVPYHTENRSGKVNELPIQHRLALRLQRSTFPPSEATWSVAIPPPSPPLLSCSVIAPGIGCQHRESSPSVLNLSRGRVVVQVVARPALA